MPLLYQSIIKRADAQHNASALYAFGDNLVRRGYGGLAKELRGEPNAVGIPTKKAPSMQVSAFFDDSDACIQLALESWVPAFARLKQGLRAGYIVVWPTNGLGIKLAELPQRAPKLFGYLQERLSELQWISDGEMK